MDKAKLKMMMSQHKAHEAHHISEYQNGTRQKVASHYRAAEAHKDAYMKAKILHNNYGKDAEDDEYNHNQYKHFYTRAKEASDHANNIKEDLELDEVLNIQQRQARKMIMRRYHNKLERAKELAQKKMAPEKNIKKRAYAEARQIVRRKFAGSKGAEYEKLGPSEKISIDRAIEKKQALIKRIALRLIPRVKAAEQKRLQSFVKGHALMNTGAPEGHTKVNENFMLFAEKFDVESEKSKLDTGPNDGKTKNNTGKVKTNNTEIKYYNKFGEQIIDALDRKSEKSGIDIEVLGEVYSRGLDAWNDHPKVTREQYAFARVNSFINKGKSYYDEDADLHELSTNTLKSYVNKAKDDEDKSTFAYAYSMGHKQIRDKGDYAKRADRKSANRNQGILNATDRIMQREETVEEGKRGLWDNIHAKRKRIKAGSGERMRKPGSEGAPTAKNFKDAQESVELDELSQDLLDRYRKKRINSHKYDITDKYDKHVIRAIGKIHDDDAFDDELGRAKDAIVKVPASKKRHYDVAAGKFGKFKEEVEVEESNNTPYVKPHIENGSTKQSGWKASNKHGRVKYFGMDFKKSAEKHAGIAEEVENDLQELTVRRTKKFIQKAHDNEQGQMYGDMPYSQHPKMVARIGKRFFGARFNQDAIKVALLHDVLEDTPYTDSQLMKKGFSQKIVDAVKLLTKNKSLSYVDNIKAIINSKNELAMMVKYADNYANFTGDKSHWPKEKAAAAQSKYFASLNALGDVLGIKKHVNEELDEKLTHKTPMSTYIRDFQNSDAPQFKGKSLEKRREMAIAAKLAKEETESSKRKKIENVDRPPATKGVLTRQGEIQKKIIDESKDLNETFNIAFASGVGVTLTSADYGMKIQGGFALHPSVIAEIEQRQIEEDAVSALKKPVYMPPRRRQDGSYGPAKTILRKTGKKIIDNPSQIDIDSDPHDGQ